MSVSREKVAWICPNVPGACGVSVLLFSLILSNLSLAVTSFDAAKKLPEDIDKPCLIRLPAKLLAKCPEFIPVLATFSTFNAMVLFKNRVGLYCVFGFMEMNFEDRLR